MAKKSEDRKRAFIILEIGFVALLGWIVLTSDATSLRGKTVQAGSIAVNRHGAKAAQENDKSKDQYVTPEGIPETASTELLAQLGTPCVQDDSTGSFLQYDSVTGNYLFNDCHGVLVSGKAAFIVKGSITTLQDYETDRRVLAKVDRSVMKGSASVQLFSPSRLFTITDRNTADDTCSCP